jgi:hypothetical protein
LQIDFRGEPYKTMGLQLPELTGGFLSGVYKFRDPVWLQATSQNIVVRSSSGPVGLEKPTSLLQKANIGRSGNPALGKYIELYFSDGELARIYTLGFSIEELREIQHKFRTLISQAKSSR